ncbi:MAG: DNA internalization-related competence protein ComEC/Rec2 [Candidatus Thioglobus sp.]|nr:MAG: DNA internalization-related competence protein ComEC/Rec2 [Candidatus Thioglobus sp.]
MSQRFFSAIGFAVGIGLMSFQSTLLPAAAAAGLLIFGLASVGAGIVRPCGWVFIGLVWSNLFAVWSLHQRPAEYWFLDQIQLSGSIPEQSKISDDFVRFNFEVESVNNEKISKFGSPKVRLSWFDDYQVPKKGDRWRFTVKLRRPRGYWNTDVFDYEKYLFLEDITGLGYVVSGERIQRGRDTDLSVKMRFSKRINASSTLLYPDLILALGVGERGLITADRWELLRKTGLSHLVAISGLHIGLVAFWSLAVIRFLIYPFNFYGGIFPKKYLAIILSAFCAFAYAQIAGFPVPTLRAFVMLVIGVSAILLLKRVSLVSILAVTVFMFAWLIPSSIFSTAFWLSFAAVWILGSVFDAGFSRSKNELIPLNASRNRFGLLIPGVKRLILAQLSLFVGLAPLIGLLFQEISMVSPMINLLAVPVFGLLVIPVVMAGVVVSSIGLESFGDRLIGLGDFLIFLVFNFADFFERRSWSVIQLGQYSLLFLVIVSGFLLCYLLKAKKIQGIFFLSGIGILAFNSEPPQQFSSGEFSIRFIDVGQGLAAIIRTQNHSIAYDFGPAFGLFSPAKDSIERSFRQHQKDTFDVAVVSHRAADHAGGLASVKSRLKGSTIVSGQPLINGDRRCVFPMRWNFDGVDFRFLNRPDIQFGEDNNKSCVLHIKGKFGTALFTGDLERPAEVALSHLYGRELGADVLQIPHHGSHSSSSTLFLSQVNPKLGILSRGVNNRYGHPSDRVVSRYRQRGIRILDTARVGQIYLVSRRSGWDETTYIDRNVRIWRSTD